MAKKYLTKSSLFLVISLLFVLSIIVFFTTSGLNIFELRNKAGTANEAIVRSWEFNGTNSEGWIVVNDTKPPITPPVSGGLLMLTNRYLPITYSKTIDLAIKKDTKIKIYLAVRSINSGGGGAPTPTIVPATPTPPNPTTNPTATPGPSSTPTPALSAFITSYLPYTGEFVVRIKNQTQPISTLSFTGLMDDRFTEYTVTIPDSLVGQVLTNITLRLSGPTSDDPTRVDWIRLSQPVVRPRITPPPCGSPLQRACPD